MQTPLKKTTNTQSYSIGLFSLAFLITFIIVTWIVTTWIRNTALNETLTSNKQQLQLYATHIEGTLGKFESVPLLLSSNQRVLKVLQQSKNYSARQALNEFFEQSAKSTGALDIYLMDKSGTTVAASNWQDSNTFIGRNFNYRPYFKQSMQGKPGRYFALGTTSRVRGYYFSYPVRSLGQIIGAVVLKMDISILEEHWRVSNKEVLITDPNGIVFIATNAKWHYRSIKPLSPQTLTTIKNSARYPNIKHSFLAFKHIKNIANSSQIVEINKAKSPERFMMLEHAMPNIGWTLHLLTPLQEVNRRVFNSVLMTIAVFIVLALLTAVLIQRRSRREERLRCDKEAQLALKKAHAQLEQRVEERTADLRIEVDERRRAEAALRTAQDELVQAAKLAMLGQMSASITHELNQPLTAIRSYTDNAQQFLQRKRYDDVSFNLTQIAELIDRMGQISSQLKLFSRKSDGQRTPVSLINELEVALKILNSEIKKYGTKLDVELGDESIQVLADATRLEQVLVNLIGNALHAMEKNAAPKLTIRTRKTKEHLFITIQDNGSGISEENLEKIFDPFFTTRKTGLGLGLAISQRIIENIGGQLSAANAPNSGAIFTLQLEIAHSAS